MALTEEQISVLDSIRNEWNQAEEEIKLAEQVCNEVVVPAIKELRYAGRRLIDLIEKVLTDPTSSDIPKLLADAEFDCHRARHDAVDAASSKIAIQLEIMADKLGYDVILAVAPEYKTIAQTVVAIRKKISVSRKLRDDRRAVYEAISAASFPGLVDLYMRMKASEEIMKKMAARNRQRDFFGEWGFWLGIAAFVIGTAIGVYGIYLTYHPPNDSSSPKIELRLPR